MSRAAKVDAMSELSPCHVGSGRVMTVRGPVRAADLSSALPASRAW